LFYDRKIKIDYYVSLLISNIENSKTVTLYFVTCAKTNKKKSEN